VPRPVNGVQLGNTETDHKAIFDLYSIGENGERFIKAELQNNFGKWMYILQQLPYLPSVEEALADLKTAWNESLKAEEKFKATLQNYI